MGLFVRKEILQDLDEKLEEKQTQELYGSFTLEVNFQKGIIQNVNFTEKKSKKY